MKNVRPSFIQISLQNNPAVGDLTMVSVLRGAFHMSDDDAVAHIQKTRKEGSSVVYKSTNDVCETKMSEVYEAQKNLAGVDSRAMSVRFVSAPVPNDMLLRKA